MHTVNTCTLSFLSPNVAHNCCPLYSWCACSDSSSLAVSQNCHYLGSPVCWLYYLKNLTNCSHAAHGYHIKNIRSDVHQMYERSQFNSLVWDSLTLTSYSTRIYDWIQHVYSNICSCLYGSFLLYQITVGLLYCFQIHQRLVEQNMWGHRLKGLSWRIDVKTKARHIDQLNQPTAIMEMQLSKEGSDKVHVNVLSS